MGLWQWGTIVFLIEASYVNLTTIGDYYDCYGI